MPKNYSDEFKLQCVKTIIENQMTIQAASEKFKAGKRNLVKWLHLYEQGMLLPDKARLDAQKLKQLERENKRLIRENSKLNEKLKLLSA
ncbi:transposase [Psychrosphaera sp. B3R10]|uniref:transposase n=1 Tax=unclassified Psychrosphaera TaxID=2641570 RepID=UPI001C096040|nr:MULTISPECIES: transposase [unclassified Psychrosphaera]MBU2883598.1 transposase [Psychrosphaera sp. I2R16]MBU2989776.1 transposase [Psychrosphaera sp. B3R10]